MLQGENRVLITGGSGVIGRVLVSILRERTGAVILSVDRLPFPASIPDVSFLEMDLAEHSMDELRAFDPTVIFHLAASFERAKEEEGFWQVNWHDNLLATHRLVSEAFSMPSLRTIVFASSYLTYKPDQYMSESPAPKPDIDERSPIGPRNLCGFAKLYAEGELSFLSTFRRELRTIYARIFRVYGRDSRDVVSRWIRMAMDSSQKLEVFNADNSFDYIFADDVAEGLLRLAASDSARGVVNLGTGIRNSIADVLSLLESLPSTNGTLRDRLVFRGNTEALESSRASVTKLERLLNWTPETTLESGMRAVAEFETGRRNSKGKGTDPVHPLD